jgi:hypothetical protein
MFGRIDFQYDEEHDIVIATPHWKVETEADLVEWYDQYARYFRRFDRKMDVILVLDDFTIAPGIGALWGECRARVHKAFIRLSYRVHSDKRVRLFVNTSGVRFDVGRDEAGSVEEAIALIVAARQGAES